jgi:hypothetical protein
MALFGRLTMSGLKENFPEELVPLEKEAEEGGLPALYGKPLGGEEVLLWGKEKPGAEETYEGPVETYRGWRLRWSKPKKEPRLGAVTSEEVWEPGGRGIVESDWKGRGSHEFKRTRQGLYSVHEFEELLKQYPDLDIYGKILPFGLSEPGSIGIRSEKAKVKSIFKSKKHPICYICGAKGKFFAHNDMEFILCERDAKRVEKLAQKYHLGMEEVESLIHQLADIYQAEVEDEP